MTLKSEGKHTGEFIVSEANGYRSRDEVTVASGENLVAGQVYMLVGGEAVALEYDSDVGPAVSAAGIIYDNVDASAAAKQGTAIVRDAEVNLAKLTYTDQPQALVVADLLALGIITR